MSDEEPQAEAPAPAAEAPAPAAAGTGAAAAGALMQKWRYTPPTGTDTPVLQAGKYWQAGSKVLLTPEEGRTLEGVAGFTRLATVWVPTPPRREEP